MTIVPLIARSHLAEIHRRAGRRVTPRMEARAVLDFAEAEGLAEHPEATVANLTLAGVLVDTGRADDGTAFASPRPPAGQARPLRAPPAAAAELGRQRLRKHALDAAPTWSKASRAGSCRSSGSSPRT